MDTSLSWGEGQRDESETRTESGTEHTVNYPLSKATWSEDRMGVVGVLGELVVR